MFFNRIYIFYMNAFSTCQITTDGKFQVYRSDNIWWYSIWSVEIISHVHDSILSWSWRLHLIFFKISSWSYPEFRLLHWQNYWLSRFTIYVSSLKWRIDSYAAQFAYYDDKGSRRKRLIYISCTRYPHDLRIERGSRDYTLCQIEEFRHVVSRYVSRFEKCDRDRSCSWKKKSHTEDYYHHDDIVFSDDDTQIGRATSCDEYVQYHDRKLWYWEGYYFKLTSWRSTRSFPSLCVDLTNVTNDRSRTLVETDWRRFIILIMSSLSTLWFYVT